MLLPDPNLPSNDDCNGGGDGGGRVMVRLAARVTLSGSLFTNCSFVTTGSKKVVYR